MSMDGWVKLWRTIADSRVFVNSDLLKVWIWCLVRANHSGQWVTIRTGRGETEVWVDPGQFIYGRKSAAKALKMKPTSVRSRMQKLVGMQNIATQPATHYSVVTICNWKHYQRDTRDDGQPTGQASANQVPGKCQPSATDKNVENDKTVENGEEKQSAAKVTWTGTTFTIPPAIAAEYAARWPHIPAATIAQDIRDCASYHAERGTKMKSPKGRITTWLKNSFDKTTPAASPHVDEHGRYDPHEGKGHDGTPEQWAEHDAYMAKKHAAEGKQ